MDVSIQRKHLEPDDAIRVQLQDNYESELVGLYICKFLNFVYLSKNAVLDSRILYVNSGHSLTAGDIFSMKENGHFYQAKVTNVSTNDITLDSPVDYPFSVNSECARSTNGMNVDGSSTTQIFSVKPPFGTKWDILGCGFHMLDNVDMDDAKFGGLTALTNGIVVRKKDGVYKNIFNIKSNGDFYFRCDEVLYSSKAPSGFYGLTARKTFNIRHGISIRLDGNKREEFQVLIQDNLSELASFYASVWGHRVE